MKSVSSGNVSVNLVLTVVCLCVLLVFMIAFGEHQLRKNAYELAVAEQSINLDEVHISLQKRIGGYLNDLQFVYETPPIQGMERAAGSAGQDEIEEATNLKIRVDNEAKSCLEPINITQQCMTYRSARQGCDLIRYCGKGLSK